MSYKYYQKYAWTTVNVGIYPNIIKSTVKMAIEMV